MYTELTMAIQTIKGFVRHNQELKERFEKLAEEIVEINRDNVRALIPVGNIEETTVDIGDLEYFEDYEVMTFSKTDEDGNEWETEEEYEEHVRKEADNIFNQYTAERYIEQEDYAIFTKEGEVYSDGFESEEEAADALEELKEEGENVEGMTIGENHIYSYRILDAEGDEVQDSFDTEEWAKEEIASLKEEYLEEELDKYSSFEERYDEVYWNTVFQYNGSADIDLAKQLGLGVLQFNRGAHDGEQFLFLRGCGMDLSPKLIAYKALEFGYIPQGDIYKLERETDREYFQYVVGQGVYENVLETLKIKNLVQTA